MKEDTRKELSNEWEHCLTPQEEDEFFLMVDILEARHAIDQARKGNTIFLIDYLQKGGDPHDRLRDYLLDVLLHKVRVPKPRPAVERAHREYRKLARQMARDQFIRGYSSEEATRLQEGRGVDHSKLERARRRYPWHRNKGLAHVYLYSFRDPAKARAAIEKFTCDNFPHYWTERYRRTGGTK